ncbi:CTP synthetase [Halobacteriales archaeon QS_6_71_20]|nr:MAG: CTP synthetase [Halobacteriales archaeon QS_6_71_20]
MTDLSAVVAGPDAENLGDALESLDVTVSRIDGAVTGGALADAGIADAALFVLTDLGEATGIAVAKEHNPDVRAVVYAGESLPEFARGQTDLAVDPEVLSAEAVADELVAAE